jgi:hypothetical protein
MILICARKWLTGEEPEDGVVVEFVRELNAAVPGLTFAGAIKAAQQVRRTAHGFDRELARRARLSLEATREVMRDDGHRSGFLAEVEDFALARTVVAGSA